MNNQLFIPSKIKVGYQERADTYTKRLAYVIYYDNKGVLRKETSWKGWIDKGHDGYKWVYENSKSENKFFPELVRDPLPTDDFENNPTEGFVLNKKAGGYDTGWNHRNTYCRVWDPRGFEFEITIPNLLFILQETSSLKGKGLEGEFVYAWEGKDLVLLPATCQEYLNSEKFTKLQGTKVSMKEMVPGHSYETKSQEILTYLGKFETVNNLYSWSDSITFAKKFVFINKKNEYVKLEGISSLAKVSNDTVVSNFAELIENFKLSDESGYIKELTTTPVYYDKKSHNYSYYGYSHNYKAKVYTRAFIENEGVFTEYALYSRIKETHNAEAHRYFSRSEYEAVGFVINPVRVLTYKNGFLSEKKLTPKPVGEVVISLDEINKMGFKKIHFELNSGKKVNIE